MKRKISLLVLSILFLIIGIIQPKGISLLAVIIFPFTIVGDLLRLMSINSGFLNILSVILYVTITLIPILILIYKVKIKDILKYEYYVLPILSIFLGLTVYYFINPHILYNGLNEIIQEITPMDSISDLETILKSGIAYLFYSLLAMYGVTRITYSKKYKSLQVVKGLINIIMVTILISILTVALSSTITIVKDATIIQEKGFEIISYILSLGVSALLIYLLENVRDTLIDFHNDGFNKNVVLKLNSLHRLSYILLMTLFATQFIKNGYQFLVLKDLLNISFVFDVPIVSLLLTTFIYILSKYVTKATKLKEENELII